MKYLKFFESKEEYYFEVPNIAYGKVFQNHFIEFTEKEINIIKKIVGKKTEIRYFPLYFELDQPNTELSDFSLRITDLEAIDIHYQLDDIVITDELHIS